MGNPRQVDRCSYFVGRQYYHPSVSGGDEVTLSHIEIVTSSGLLQLVDDLCGDEDRINEVFPLEAINGVLSSK